MESEIGDFPIEVTDRVTKLVKAFQVDEWIRMVWESVGHTNQTVYFTNEAKEQMEFKITENSVRGVRRIVYSLYTDLWNAGYGDLAEEVVKAQEEGKNG